MANRWNRHGIDPSAPAAGWFSVRMTKGGPRVAAKLEVLDGVMRATVNGHLEPVYGSDPKDTPLESLARGASDPVLRVWHYGEAITESDYRHLVETARWAEKHDPSHPAARPGKPVDFGTMKPIF